MRNPALIDALERDRVMAYEWYYASWREWCATDHVFWLKVTKYAWVVGKDARRLKISKEDVH